MLGNFDLPKHEKETINRMCDTSVAKEDYVVYVAREGKSQRTEILQIAKGYLAFLRKRDGELHKYQVKLAALMGTPH